MTGTSLISMSKHWLVRLLTIDSKRLRAVRIENTEWKILMVCVYLSYKDGYANINAFSEEVSHLESLIDNNPDCHVVICSDFNVDFSRNCLHTEILSSFCDGMNIRPVCGHRNYSIDYTYNFKMGIFYTLDYFLLSGMLYANMWIELVSSMRMTNFQIMIPLY